MLFTYILLSVIFSLLLVYELFYHRKLRAYAKQLPGPAVYPFVGSAMTFLGSTKHFADTVHNLFIIHGNRIGIVVGHELEFLLADPMDAKVIMSSKVMVDKSSEYNCIAPYVGGSTFLLPAFRSYKNLRQEMLRKIQKAGEKWRTQRRFVLPTFNTDFLKNTMPIIEKNVDQLTRKFSEFTGGKSTDVSPYISLCTFDIIVEATMGVSVNAQINDDSKYLQAVHGMCDIIQLRMQHVFLRHDIFFNISFSKLRQENYLKTIAEFADHIIRKKRAALANNILHGEETGGARKQSFLDRLLMSNKDGVKLSDKTIHSEINSFIFAGQDTANTSLGFALYNIAKHSDVQNKILAEQQSIFGDDKDRPIEYNDIQQMNYLAMVIKESLRLYPAGPMIGRKINEDCVINDLKVPKGTNVIISLFHLQRHPDLFEDPDSFKPERFSSAPDNSVNRTIGYMPFSSGPRNCIGQRFAEIELKMSISKLVRQFEFHPGDEEPVIEIPFVLKSANGIHLKLTKRQ